MCPITSREAVFAYHSMCFVKVFLPSPYFSMHFDINASYIPHLFAVHDTRSHKSCNNSTTGWRATFRSLDDFPVPVKQCRFKVYLDNLEFSFRKQIVVKPTNSYKSLNKCQELLCLHGKHNAFANSSFSMVFYVFLLGLENYQNPYKNKHFEKSISSQSLSVHLSACCLPANQSGYAIAIADETADDIDNDIASSERGRRLTRSVTEYPPNTTPKFLKNSLNRLFIE